MAFVEDLSEFFDTADGFAVPAVFNGAETVNGIIDHNYSDIDGGMGEMVGNMIVFTAPVNEFSESPHRGTLLIGGITYDIHAPKKDGTGALYRMRLTVQD